MRWVAFIGILKTLKMNCHLKWFILNIDLGSGMGQLPT